MPKVGFSLKDKKKKQATKEFHKGLGQWLSRQGYTYCEVGSESYRSLLIKMAELQINRFLTCYLFLFGKIMKKIFVILSLAMAVFSFQANAATLNWVSTPAKGIATGDTQNLLGDVANLAKGTKVNDVWKFHLDGLSLITLEVTSVPKWLTSVSFSGGLLHNLSTKSAGLWTFDGILKTGDYSITVIGKALSNHSGYQVGVQTPIPAAMWLFGSALMGLTGVSRRKLV